MILGILQARLSSSRLPGKVLLPIQGKPMLQLQIERIRRCKNIDRIIVATSTSQEDMAIKDLCDSMQIPCYQGQLDNVLDRFYQAALLYYPDHIVRLTGDCPLIDPEITDQTIEYYLQNNYDYVSNTAPNTFPDGLDTEIFSFPALKKAWQKAKLPSQQEHATLYIHGQPQQFRIGHFKGLKNHPFYHWSVDEPEDFEFVKQVYDNLYPQKPGFKTDDIFALLEQKPELIDINNKIQRQDGLQKSLQQDKKWLNTPQSQRIPITLACQSRAIKRVPGMTQLLSKRPDLYSLGVWPAYFAKASGVMVWDLDGNQYIDMSIGGIGANVLGYADPDVNASVLEAIAVGNSSSLNCPEDVELADLLCELHPWAESVRYARTGGEAMAIAVRIARAHAGRDKIAFCGYHGWHDWYLAANIGTKNALGEHLLPGLNPTGVPRCLQGTAFPFRYNHLEELKKIAASHGPELAAIVMEPIRNIEPTREFIEGVRAIADELNTVLVVDEISAAFRMNTGGAHLQLGLQPDIAVFSKALGNGYPIAAIIGKGPIMEAAQKTFISSTYWTERIGPVAALATIKKHRLVDAGTHLMDIGSQVQMGWKHLSQKHKLTIAVGGIPPLSHFSFEGDDAPALKALFVQEMLQLGFLASTSFYSMYAHQQEHVDQYLMAVDQVFATLIEAGKAGDIAKRLQGNPAVAGFKRLA